jgi:hypothetical protein
MKRAIGIVAMLVVMAGAFEVRASAAVEEPMNVKQQLKKFAPVKIEAEKRLITKRLEPLVEELVAAARLMDEIFLRQVSEGNVALREKLALRGKEDAALYDYFMLNFGPFDRLDHNRPFVKGVGKKPAGANFYPADMSRAEFESWIKKHPRDRTAFESSFTVIRREGKGLSAVPYSRAYGELLERAAGHLRKAAMLTRNDSLRTYLTSRADAFLSNDYYDSDVDWVKLKDHDIEVVIGPYEVYEDELFGLKAAFEAFVTRVDPKESARLSKVVDSLDDLEKNLPIEDKYKGIGRNLSSPIVVAQLIYSAGDTKSGVQTIAFNLPNDERVREQEGSKKVMLKNVQRAKYEKILRPIAKRTLRARDVKDVDFEAFFAHTLLREVSHGIGPGKIRKGGKKTTVNRELKDLYAVIEECKADTLGVYNAIYLTDQKLYPRGFMDKAWATYLAGLFRSIRFGIREAHGGGNAIQFNYLREKGAITSDADTGKFGIDREKIVAAVRDLARDVLMIEAKGDYDAAAAFVARYRKMTPEMQRALERLRDVPVDIRPRYAYK